VIANDENNEIICELNKLINKLYIINQWSIIFLYFLSSLRKQILRVIRYSTKFASAKFNLTLTFFHLSTITQLVYCLTISGYTKPEGWFTVSAIAGLAWELPYRNTLQYGKPAEVYHRRSRRELYRKAELMLRTWVRKAGQRQGSQRGSAFPLLTLYKPYRWLRGLYIRKKKIKNKFVPIMRKWRWKFLLRRTTRKNMNRCCNDYDILRRSVGKSNISSFYFASESISFFSTDQI